MFKRKNIMKYLLMALLALTLTAAITNRAMAQAAGQPVSQAIAEDKMPWKGWPWLVGVLFMGGTLAVGFKNAKRTHLD